MRRLGLIISVAGLATLLISIATLAAGAQTNTATNDAQAEPSGPNLSQGTVTGASRAELRAIHRDVAQEERLPEYSQVVDNANSRRFEASGWKRGGKNSWAHGGDYVSAGAATDARFKLRAPTDGDYALYAWWPAREANSSAARFGVETASGTKWTEVDQTKDGGIWVQIGTFEMKAGDKYVVRLSSNGGSGEVVADAVALVRGVASPPPEDLAPAEGGPTNGGTTAGSGENDYTASSTRRQRRAVVRQGRKHIGTRYRLSPPAPCWAYRKEDCSCFTKLVFRHFGKRLVDNPVRLYWRKNRKWVAKRNLKRGDLVFFKEHGWNRPITHVGMYSGHGNLLHASSYFGKVVESKMKYIKGYFGARRVRKLN
jgi:cell wall-associated NlpC family hydrolase